VIYCTTAGQRDATNSTPELLSQAQTVQFSSVQEVHNLVAIIVCLW